MLRSLILAAAGAAAAAADAQCAQALTEDATSLLQLDHHTSLQQHERARGGLREAGSAKAKEWGAKNLARLAALYGRQPGPPPASPAWPPGPNSFTSVDKLFCIEGEPRAVEGHLALKKAGITGRLFENVTVQPRTCAERGYGINAGPDNCYPDTNMFMANESDGQEFGNRELEQWNIFALEYDLTLDQVHLMFDCTCKIGSPHREERGAQCEALYDVPGAWVHHDPAGGPGQICDGGPFVSATWALAMLKSSPQSPMHLHDRIAATTCEALGFPNVFPPIDHCFPPLYMYYRTDNMTTDPGIAASQQTESALFGGGGYTDFLAREHMNVGLFSSIVGGCHCLEGSSVLDALSCSEVQQPPIKDWFRSSPEPSNLAPVAGSHCTEAMGCPSGEWSDSLEAAAHPPYSGA